MKFGPEYARKLKRRSEQRGDIWHLDDIEIILEFGGIR
jgi:transposase-like protein